MRSTYNTAYEKFMYKIRKLMGLTLFEDACNEVTDEDIKNFKKDTNTSNDWVTPASFTGM